MVLEVSRRRVKQLLEHLQGGGLRGEYGMVRFRSGTTTLRRRLHPARYYSRLSAGRVHGLHGPGRDVLLLPRRFAVGLGEYVRHVWGGV